MSDVPENITVTVDGRTLPVIEVLTGRGFITGKSGSGKSNTASVIAEELLDNGLPLLIVDTDGEYYGLKESYELLHVGASENCDAQVRAAHAPKLAELALEQGVPIILDVSGFLDQDDANELVRNVVRSLFTREKKTKRPFLLLVEEIHEYLPESGGLDDVGEVLIQVAKRGRKHGLGLVGMSQRPAAVDKDFITQCDWLVWHRLTWDNDTKVVKQVLGSEAAETVPELDDGQALLVTDWDGQEQTVQFRRKRTFDAGATPGLEDVERPDLKSVGGDLVEELKALKENNPSTSAATQEELEEVIEAKNERIGELQDKIVKLEHHLEKLEEELQKERDKNAQSALPTASETSDAAATETPAGAKPTAGDGGGETVMVERDRRPMPSLERDPKPSKPKRPSIPEAPDDEPDLLWELTQFFVFVFATLKFRIVMFVRSVGRAFTGSVRTLSETDWRDPVDTLRTDDGVQRALALLGVTLLLAAVLVLAASLWL
ncbi:ATP-binding protein [Halobacteriaceae archaeon GCM10025711]